MTEETRIRCHAAIHAGSAAAAAAASGAAQLPLSDSVILIPIQVSMVVALGAIFDITMTESLAAAVIRAHVAKITGRLIARSITSLAVGWLPGAGNVINAATAALITETLGWEIAEKFDRTARGESTLELEERPTMTRAEPKRGDVICVKRYGSYAHYGVYESDDAIYAYGTDTGDFWGAGPAAVRKISLNDFLDGVESCYVVQFPETLVRNGEPVPDYRLRSPSETIKRAQESLGHTGYDLITNNCEHFALWCKTGVHLSFQVDRMLDALVFLPMVGMIF